MIWEVFWNSNPFGFQLLHRASTFPSKIVNPCSEIFFSWNKKSAALMRVLQPDYQRCFAQFLTQKLVTPVWGVLPSEPGPDDETGSKEHLSLSAIAPAFGDGVERDTVDRSS